MEIRQELFPAYFLWSIPVGFLLGAVYEVFRLLRRIRKSGTTADTVLCIAEDLLFGLISGIVLTLTAYALNCGRVRFFPLLAALFGFLLWHFLPGRLLMRGADRVLSCLQNAVLRRRSKRKEQKRKVKNDARKRKNVILRKNHRASLHRNVHRDDRSSADAMQ